MNLRTLSLAAPLAFVLACGGSSTTGTGSTALNAATPAFSALSLDQTSADSSAPATALMDATAPAAPSTPAMTGHGGGCHPHLFMREREVVERVNRHIYKVLRRVEKLIAANPVDETTTSKTWTKTEDGADLSFTVKWIGPNKYSWEFSAAPTGKTLQPVMSGVIDRSLATGPHQGSGTMSVDFAALDAALPGEKVAQGKLDVQFDVSATSRKITVVADQIAWEMDPHHFDGDVVPPALTAPRSGAYVYYREPGKGGSLKIQDQMVFACGMDPRTANVALVPADAQMVSRWYIATDGTIHGRSDGLLTGGNLVAPVARIVGVTCHAASAEQHMQTEGFWLMKAEDASGATLSGGSSISMMDTTAAPCDPAYGAVPNLTDAQNDFKGWPESYSDNAYFPFLPL